jgi:GGDEF domain-containing protein
MKRYLAWAISLGCSMGGLLLLLLAPESLQTWWSETFQGKMVHWLPHLPVLLLGIAALWGSHLRQDKVALLALFMAGTHALLTLSCFPAGLSSDALREGIAVFLPWVFPLLLGWPETSLKSLLGWARLGAVFCIWLGASVWACNHGFASFWPAHLASVPGGAKTLSTLLAILALWNLSSEKRRDLRLSWTCALISLGFASLHGEPWWPGSVSSAPWPVFFSFSALFVLGGLYGMTWRRAYLDELTGMPGRRAFDESLRRLGRKYAIAMVDVDHFKRFNDRYGHQVGDQILRFIASRLKGVSFGLAFRYGGEEFAIIMPGRKVHAVLPLLERLRQSIEAYKFTIRGENRPLCNPPQGARPSDGQEQVGVTVSIGVAGRSFLQPTAEAVLRTADEALYQAKRMGRNRVETERRRNNGGSEVKRISCREEEKEAKDGRQAGTMAEIAARPI